MIQRDMAPKDRGPADGAHPKTLDQIGRKGCKRSEDKRLEENKLKYLYRANSSTILLMSISRSFLNGVICVLAFFRTLWTRYIRPFAIINQYNYMLLIEWGYLEP